MVHILCIYTLIVLVNLSGHLRAEIDFRNSQLESFEQMNTDTLSVEDLRGKSIRLDSVLSNLDQVINKIK